MNYQNHRYRQEIRELQAEIDSLRRTMPDEREKAKKASDEAHRMETMARVQRDHATKMGERFNAHLAKLRKAQESLSGLIAAG